jgi:hypothetical protein
MINLAFEVLDHVAQDGKVVVRHLSAGTGAQTGAHWPAISRLNWVGVTLAPVCETFG